MLVDRGAIRAGTVAALGCVALMALSALWAGVARAALPDGRRFELVTPVSKNAADVLPNPQRTRAAGSGDAVQFSSLTGFGDVHGGSRATDYVAVRGLDGVWRTHGIFPMQDSSAFIPDFGAGLEPRYVGEFASDLSHGVFLAKTSVTTAPNVAHAINLYLRTDVLSPGAGAYQLLTDAISDQGIAYEPQIQPVIAGASADFSHVLFESPRSLVAETAGLDPTALKLYMWVDGTVRFEGMVPSSPDTSCSGNACVTAPQSQAGQGASVENAYTLGTISQNGQHVIFTVVQDPSLPHAGSLYLRDDQGTAPTGDDTTTQINASERTDCSGDLTCGGDTVPDPAPDTPEPAVFWAASSDGSKIFFTTPEQLTDDDPNDSNDLYLYDLNSTNDHLTRLSVDTEPDDNPNGDLANGHQVAGVLGASQDGNTVYFAVNRGQLIDGRSITAPVGDSGALGDARIYIWRAGVLREVGGINGGGSTELPRVLGASGWGRQSKLSRISPDGSHLAFITLGTDQLLSNYGKPEYDHGTTCNSGLSLGSACAEVYVYDADANGGAGDLQCASCNPTGVAAKGDAQFVVQFAGGATLDASHLNHAVSDDGRYVFFDSTDQLVPDDKNAVDDAYEFDTQTGQVHLLTSGSTATRQIFLDASADGSDVFVLTRARLRSEDNDQSADIYDVKINGTVDPGPSSVRSCEDEDCRSAATPTAMASNPASALFGGPGDRLEPHGPGAFFQTQSLTARQRHRLAKRGATQLTISASAPGSLVVRIAIRAGGHTRTIQVIRRTLKRAATIHPRIRLTERARRALRSRGQLRIVITTTYSQAPTPQVTRATLRTSRRR